jgi:hypothetical protein
MTTEKTLLDLWGKILPQPPPTEKKKRIGLLLLCREYERLIHPTLAWTYLHMMRPSLHVAPHRFCGYPHKRQRVSPSSSSSSSSLTALKRRKADSSATKSVPVDKSVSVSVHKVSTDKSVSVHKSVATDDHDHTHYAFPDYRFKHNAPSCDDLLNEIFLRRLLYVHWDLQPSYIQEYQQQCQRSCFSSSSSSFSTSALSFQLPTHKFLSKKQASLIVEVTHRWHYYICQNYVQSKRGTTYWNQFFVVDGIANVEKLLFYRIMRHIKMIDIAHHSSFEKVWVEHYYFLTELVAHLQTRLALPQGEKPQTQLYAAWQNMCDQCLRVLSGENLKSAIQLKDWILFLLHFSSPPPPPPLALSAPSPLLPTTQQLPDTKDEQADDEYESIHQLNECYYDRGVVQEVWPLDRQFCSWLDQLSKGPLAFDLQKLISVDIDLLWKSCFELQDDGLTWISAWNRWSDLLWVNFWHSQFANNIPLWRYITPCLFESLLVAILCGKLHTRSIRSIWAQFRKVVKPNQLHPQFDINVTTILQSTIWSQVQKPLYVSDHINKLSWVYMFMFHLYQTAPIATLSSSVYPQWKQEVCEWILYHNPRFLDKFVDNGFYFKTRDHVQFILQWDELVLLIRRTQKAQSKIPKERILRLSTMWHRILGSHCEEIEQAEAYFANLFCWRNFTTLSSMGIHEYLLIVWSLEACRILKQQQKQTPTSALASTFSQINQSSPLDRRLVKICWSSDLRWLDCKIEPTKMQLCWYKYLFGPCPWQLLPINLNISIYQYDEKTQTMNAYDDADNAWFQTNHNRWVLQQNQKRSIIAYLGTQKSLHWQIIESDILRPLVDWFRNLQCDDDDNFYHLEI